jgi:hypothetical protein
VLGELILASREHIKKEEVRQFGLVFKRKIKMIEGYFINLDGLKSMS